jgi:hypothetical protein
MFAAACARYAPLVCNVGGGSDAEPGVRIGSGCLLSPRHVLTALHVVRPLPAKLPWPVVEKYDGVFRCAIAYEDPQEDIALLTATDPVTPDDGDAPTEFPILPSAPPRLGSSAGFLSWAKLPKDAGRVRALHFTPSAVTGVLPNTDAAGPRFILAGDVAERGATGTGVFGPTGELLGVIVKALPVTPDGADKLPRASIRPVMAALDRVLPAIRHLLGE